MSKNNPFADIPSVDKVISHESSRALLEIYGRNQIAESARSVLDIIRRELGQRQAELLESEADIDHAIPTIVEIIAQIESQVMRSRAFSLKSVLNMSGTVLHTNLGRAALPESAISSIITIARGSSNLEFDLETGKRGDRDVHIEKVITEITGAEAATVVNNNAAAVLLTLNTLALNKEVPVSRGELVEIGGSFRIPEVMSRSGCQLIEVGATNRTHLKDYQQAINANTALLMKVHTSNYEIRGFTHSVSDKELADLAHESNIPFVTDLGSGTLVDLSRYGLPHEPTAAEAIQCGADIITFSGDKLLGGPQAGIIIGKKSFIDAIKANPLKRALRVDKLTIAALFEVLNLYRDPDRLAETLPTLRFLARSVDEIDTLAKAVLPAFESVFKDQTNIGIIDTFSQVGSGSLPLDRLATRAIAISSTKSEQSDNHLQEIAKRLRTAPLPVIGRLNDGKLIFDCRTLESPEILVNALEQLSPP